MKRDVPFLNVAVSSNSICKVSDVWPVRSDISPLGVLGMVALPNKQIKQMIKYRIFAFHFLFKVNGYKNVNVCSDGHELWVIHRNDPRNDRLKNGYFLDQSK